MSRLLLPRRGLIAAGAATFGSALLGGCDQLSRSPSARRLLVSAETLTQASQRALLSGQPLAREFAPEQMSRVFRANGSTMPSDPAYQRMLENGFADYRLEIGGMVRQPLSLSLPQLREEFPARSQITRHDCVEGWSCIGKWTGVPLADLLARAELADNARFLVFHCADDLGRESALGTRYYESIDLFDAFHPQTILAYGMNDVPLPTQHGAPLRLRVERQLGYKHAKYVMRIEAVESLSDIRGGKGGYWEDRGYAWYAGI